MFLKNVALGIYYPGNSFLHRIQARTKLLLMFCLVAALVVASHFYWDFTPYLVALGLVGVGIACSRIALREFWRKMWFLLLVVLISTCLILFLPAYADDGSKLFYLFPALVFSPPVLRGLMLGSGGLLVLYLLLLFLPVAALRRPRLRRVLRWIRFIFVAFLLTVLPALIYTLASRPAHTAPALAYMITYDSFWYSGIFLDGFLVVYSCALLLTMTTSPIALIEGLTSLLTPLRWLHLPVDDFALMVLLALRFLPVLVEEIEQLIKAQAARGSSFSSGTLLERVQSGLALLLPFLRNTLRRASELSVALEARGYQVDGHQTLLYEKKLRWIDYLSLLLVGGALLTALLI